MSNKYILPTRDIVLVATLLLASSCADRSHKLADWDSINYAKLHCGGETGSGKDCGSLDAGSSSSINSSGGHQGHR